ncbi:MAG: hypothetical protein ACLVLH_09915 [Eisenbergiella massiliensis]
MEKEKRGNKKKGGKKVLAAAACIGLLAAAGGFFFWQKSNADAAEGAVVIEAGENGEIIYAQIDNIVGNDIDVSSGNCIRIRERRTERFRTKCCRTR